MNTQTLTATPMMTCSFVVAIPETDFPAGEPVYASSRDYGFDFDDTELAEELVAPLSLTTHKFTISDVDTNEVEQALRYYFS